MKQRGRRSASDLAMMLPVNNVRHTLTPPDHLSEVEAALFREVLHNTPANQFSFSDQYLLATFCQITCLMRAQAERVRTAKREHRGAELKLLLDSVKAQSLVATKLRLVTSARTKATTIHRAHDLHKPSAYAMIDWTDNADAEQN